MLPLYRRQVPSALRAGLAELHRFARISRASRYNSAAIVTEASKGDHRIRFQGPIFAALLLISIVAGGTIGYMLIEGWSAWDAFYMTVITVTTVGYKEVHDLSWAGQAFTILIIVSGVGAALYSFTLLAAVVVEGGLPKRFQRRRAARMLETIKDHFIICGYGRIGSLIAAQFRRQNVPYVIVESNAQRHQLAIDEGGLAVEGDASREEVLKRVGLDRARGLIAAVSTDAENVYTVLSARVLRPDLFIIGRAENEHASEKLKHAGANRVISPYHIGAMQMAQTALRPAVVDFIALATARRASSWRSRRSRSRRPRRWPIGRSSSRTSANDSA